MNNWDRRSSSLTLTCHARQPGILAAVITAKLLRSNPELEPAESLVAQIKQEQDKLDLTRRYISSKE